VASFNTTGTRYGRIPYVPIERPVHAYRDSIYGTLQIIHTPMDQPQPQTMVLRLACLVGARSKGSPRQKAPTQSRSPKRLTTTPQEVQRKRMTQATWQQGRDLTSKSSSAWFAVSGTKYGLLVIVFGAMIVTGLPLESTKNSSNVSCASDRKRPSKECNLFGRSEK
jgi:hypothetical protein